MALVGAQRIRDQVAQYEPVDIATFLYVTVASIAALLAIRSDYVPGEGWLLLANGLLLVLIALAPRARRLGPVGRTLGDWYPILLLPALYAEVGVLTLNAGFQNDWTVQRLETWVFGSEVSYRWIREMPNLGLSWILHACYLLYVVILYGAPFGLWVTGRRDQARLTILALAVTFFLCYMVFLFFPVAGPRYAFDLPSNTAAHVWPARAAQWMLDMGDSWGAAFPSSHVAGAVVATGMAVRYWRPLGLALLPVTAGLVLGVVYGQFHYGVDALGGLVVAGLMLAVMEWWRERWAPQPVVSSVVSVLEVSH